MQFSLSARALSTSLLCVAAACAAAAARLDDKWFNLALIQGRQSKAEGLISVCHWLLLISSLSLLLSIDSLAAPMVNGRRQNALELIFMCGYIMAHHAHAESRGADKESCAKCEWTADENSSILLPLFSEPYNCCCTRREEREREGCRNFIIHAKDIVFCVNVLERERNIFIL